MQRPATVTHSWILGAIVGLAAILRFVPIWFGLEYPQSRPDEETTVGHALQILRGDPNPHFFHWPSLMFYLLAALYAGVSLVRRAMSLDAGLSPAAYLLIARCVVALAGTATVVVLFRLARRGADATTAWLAALFLSVSILHVRESHFAMTDVVMTLLVVLSLALLLRAVDVAGEGTSQSGMLRWFAAAGLAGGLATSTKYNAAALLASMAAAQLFLLLRPLWSLRTWWPSLAYVIAFAAGFVVATPYAVLDFDAFSGDLMYDVTHLSGAHGVDVGRGWAYHLRRSLPYGAGVTICAAAIAGAVPMARFHRRCAVIVGAFAVAFYLAIGSGFTVFFRYILPLIPVLCLLAAVGVRRAAPWLARRIRLPERTVLGVLMLVIAGPALTSSVWFDLLLAKTDTRVLAGRWLTSQVRSGESVHDAGSEYSRLHLPEAPVHHWRFDSTASSFGHPDGLRPDWLVLQESPLRAYANIPAALRKLATEKYVLAWSIRGTRGGARRSVYDEQDAFFVPFSGFADVERPGPNIFIYRRRE